MLLKKYVSLRLGSLLFNKIYHDPYGISVYSLTFGQFDLGIFFYLKVIIEIRTPCKLNKKGWKFTKLTT